MLQLSQSDCKHYWKSLQSTVHRVVTPEREKGESADGKRQILWVEYSQDKADNNRT